MPLHPYFVEALHRTENELHYLHKSARSAANRGEITEQDARDIRQAKQLIRAIFTRHGLEYGDRE